MVYITSHTEEGRKETEQRLRKRLEKNMEGKLPQINVYPEGTINNSETILKFKKGGFDHTYPIRIRCSRFFQDDYLSPSFVNMNVYTFILLWLTIPRFFSEFYEIEENVDPLFLLKKNNVDPKSLDAWKVIAKEVKDIMIFMTGMRGSEQGYADLLEYEQTEIYVKDTMGGTFMRRTGCTSKRDAHHPSNLQSKDKVQTYKVKAQ